jgi:hypothetical protein
MPTATITFTLPEEDHEFRLATNAGNWQSVVWEIDQYLRSQIKYAGDETPSEVVEALEKVRELLHDERISRGLIYE